MYDRPPRSSPETMLQWPDGKVKVVRWQAMRAGIERTQGPPQLRPVRRFNKIACFILNSPLHRVLSDHLMVLQFTGPNSGTTYTTPIEYVEDDGELLIAAGGRWRESPRSRLLVQVRLSGRWLAYCASIVAAVKYALELERDGTPQSNLGALLGPAPRQRRDTHCQGYDEKTRNGV